MKKLEIEVFVRQSNALKFINNMSEFNIIIFKKFPSRRNIIEKVLH